MNRPANAKDYLVTVKKGKEVVYTATVTNVNKRNAINVAERDYVCKQIKGDVENSYQLRNELLQSLKSTAIIVG